MDRDALELLTRPAAWPHPVTGMEVVETHASWVFLTGEYAYKVKKPVNFGFLDFSTLDRRRHCCEEEVRLNRRLAPDLYLGVVPITGSPPRVGAGGTPVEYAVKMRQFDMECGFDRLAERRELEAFHIDATAAVLGSFHAETPRAGMKSGFGTPAEIAEYVLENFLQIEPHIDVQSPGSRARFERVEQWSRAACERFQAFFAERLAEGYVRECHGDLHLRNIVWWRDEVVPFDCLEFNPALRWIDTMSELAFLLMDLDDHDLRGLSMRLLNGYLEHSGDFGGLKVLRFYQAYRAMVRAKVECLRLAQLDALEPEGVAALGGYLALADGYTRSLTPRLLIAHGLSGSGKTYVSQRLLEATPLVRVRSDVERKRLFSLAPGEASGSGQDAGIYSRSATEQTYDQLARTAKQLLEDGWPVLVDATFLARNERGRFRALAHTCDVPFAIMHCEADMAVQRRRVTARRGDASEANLAVLERQAGRVEPLTAEEAAAVIHVDTTGDPDLDGLLAFFEGAN